MSRFTSTVGLVVIAAIAGTACGGGKEEALVGSFFQASNAKDVRALEMVASVSLDQQVDAWSVVSASPETRSPVTLPGLFERYESAKAAFDEQKKKASRYSLDHLSAVEKVETLLKEEKEIPADLEEVAEAWAELSGREHELKAALDEAREAMEREARICQVSAGTASDLASSAGEMLTKELQVNLTIAGEVKPYVMTLRRYMLEEKDVPHEISRWMVYDVRPQG